MDFFFSRAPLASSSFVPHGSSLTSASISAHPRPDERFSIPRPLSWESRHECLGEEWCGEHKDKTFHTLQYWKDQATPWHEFIVLHLNDGSVCRVERMGEVTPGRRRDALRPTGIPAADFMQVFPASKAPDFGAASTLIATIRYPRSFKLMEVLDICYAVKLDSDAKKYTLQCFNCYFFAWTIVLVLGRRTAEWDLAFAEDRWENACKNITNVLTSTSLLPDGKLAFKLEKLLSPKDPSDANVIITEVDKRIRQQQSPLLQRSKSLLWTKEAPSCMKDRLSRSLRESVSDETFGLLFPEFDKWNLIPPISPITTEPKSWMRDHLGAAVIRQNARGGPRPHVLREEFRPESIFRPIFSKIVEPPVFEALNAVYLGAAAIAQPNAEPIPSEPWVVQLAAYLRTATKELEKHDPVLERRFGELINAHPGVDGSMWREALIHLCDDQAPFFKSSPLPRLWDQWLWDAIGDDILREVGSVIPRVEPTNLNITRPGQDDEWMSNKQLQNYIEERIQEHCALVFKCTRKPVEELKHEITEAIEEVWERFELGDKRRGFGAICQAMEGLVGAHRDETTH